jgi:4-hydroxysphinganine ceramide fatty acyl 2-hydroxylase
MFGRGLRRLLDRVTSSHLNYRAAYVLDLVVPLALAWLGWGTGLGAGAAILSFLVGAFAFSFIEYAIHRWLFHTPPSFMSTVHARHHDDPHDATALPCITSTVMSLAFWAPLQPVAGTGVTAFVISGIMAGYFWYSVLHHLEHHVRINAVPWRWLQRRWAMHSVHHKLPDKNFGVTTSLWDRLLGTHYQSARRTASDHTHQSATPSRASRSAGPVPRRSAAGAPAVASRFSSVVRTRSRSKDATVNSSRRCVTGRA